MHCSSDMHIAALLSCCFFSAERFSSLLSCAKLLNAEGKLLLGKKYSAEKNRLLGRAGACLSEEQCTCGDTIFQYRNVSQELLSLLKHC